MNCHTFRTKCNYLIIGQLNVSHLGFSHMVRERIKEDCNRSSALFMLWLSPFLGAHSICLLFSFSLW